MENDSHSETFVITNCILNVPLMLISIIGNSLVLAAILRTPCFRSVPSFIYLCGLTVSDLFVGFVVQQLYIASEITSRRISFLYSASHVTVFFACGVSLLHNDSHKCGSIHGSSLSYEICYDSDENPCHICISDNMVNRRSALKCLL